MVRKHLAGLVSNLTSVNVMTEENQLNVWGVEQMDFLKDERFKGIEKFDRKVWLSSPTMHGDEQRWVDDAIQTNWVSTVGANINEV